MSRVLGYIGDGYTESVWVDGVPNLYPRVEFSFRPMLQEELVAYGLAVEKLQGMKLREFVAGILAAKIKRWDLTDGHGNPVPLAVSHLLLFKDRLFNRLFGVVSTQDAPDGHADRDDADSAAAAADLLEAMRSDRPLAEVTEERLRKNS